MIVQNDNAGRNFPAFGFCCPHLICFMDQKSSLTYLCAMLNHAAGCWSAPMKMLFYNLNNYAYNQNISADNYESPSEVCPPLLGQGDSVGTRDEEININKA